MNTVKVLNAGYVSLVEFMGGDKRGWNLAMQQARSLVREVRNNA